jgi:hypothetical protein
MQLKPRLGIEPDAVQPIDGIPNLGALGYQREVLSFLVQQFIGRSNSREPLHSFAVKSIAAPVDRRFK